MHVCTHPCHACMMSIRRCSALMGEACARKMENTCIHTWIYMHAWHACMVACMHDMDACNTCIQVCAREMEGVDVAAVVASVQAAAAAWRPVTASDGLGAPPGISGGADGEGAALSEVVGGAKSLSKPAVGGTRVVLPSASKAEEAPSGPQGAQGAQGAPADDADGKNGRRRETRKGDIPMGARGRTKPKAKGKPPPPPPS